MIKLYKLQLYQRTLRCILYFLCTYTTRYSSCNNSDCRKECQQRNPMAIHERFASL